MGKARDIEGFRRALDRTQARGHQHHVVIMVAVHRQHGGRTGIGRIEPFGERLGQGRLAGTRRTGYRGDRTAGRTAGGDDLGEAVDVDQAGHESLPAGPSR